MHNKIIHKISNSRGVTLVEVVLAVLIAGILSTIAIRSVSTISETGRIEETKTELDALAFAITGNPALENNGTRSDFGYVGDIGALPPNLDALVSNPGGYSTWDGPYINKRYAQITNDHLADAWGTGYTYTGISISSTGSGSPIVKQVANSSVGLLYNSVSGNVYDADGTPPGNIYDDSILVLLTFPNGAGGYTTRGIYPDIGGYFSYDSIPIGNHQLEIIYLPTSDTLKRFVSVAEASAVYNEFFFAGNYWFSSGSGGGTGGGGLTVVTGTPTTYSGGCNDFTFNLSNDNSTGIMLSGLILEWDTPTAYYQKIEINGITVFSNSSPRNGSGASISFSPLVIGPGQTVSVIVFGFKNEPTGGQNVDMSNVDFTFSFSNGSVLTVNSGSC